MNGTAMAYFGGAHPYFKTAMVCYLFVNIGDLRKIYQKKANESNRTIPYHLHLR